MITSLTPVDFLSLVQNCSGVMRQRGQPDAFLLFFFPHSLHFTSAIGISLGFWESVPVNTRDVILRDELNNAGMQAEVLCYL